MNQKRTLLDFSESDIDRWSDSPIAKITKPTQMDGIVSQVPDGIDSLNPFHVKASSSPYSEFRNDLSLIGDRGGNLISKEKNSLLPRSLMLGHNHALATTPRSPRQNAASPRPTFAVASTLFQRHQTGSISPWPRHQTTVNAGSALGRDGFPSGEMVGVRSPVDMEEEGEAYDDSAYLEIDDGICADFGDSDFTPMTRIQL